MTEPPPKYQTEHRRAYHDYLRTPAWKDKRERVLRRDGYMCQSCLQAQASQVHHLDGAYKYGLYVPLFLLVSVCAPCHEKITKIDRGEIDPWEKSVEYLDELPY